MKTTSRPAADRLIRDPTVPEFSVADLTGFGSPIAELIRHESNNSFSNRLGHRKYLPIGSARTRAGDGGRCHSRH